MKLSILLSAVAAAVTTAFVLPNEQINEQILAQTIEVHSQSPSLPPKLKDVVENTLDALWYSEEAIPDVGTGFEGFAGSDDIDLDGWTESQIWHQLFLECLPEHSFDEPPAQGMPILNNDFGDDIDDDDDEAAKERPHHGHKPNPSKTIYQLISDSPHTKIFAHAVSEFREVVDVLNSTQEKLTVFVPIDSAFRKFKSHPHPKIPKEFLLKWLHYHISPTARSKRELFSVQTIPTLLEEENAAGYPQRIRTQFSLHGLKLNFFNRVIKADIAATNGIIHATGGFLIPPFSASDTIDILPSPLSTFNLGLLTTGVKESLGPETLVTGATIFAPTNFAFKLLGPKINAFLFSRWGTKYLKALLEYHIVVNRTLFSDAYYEPKTVTDTSAYKKYHVDLPSLLEDHNISVDIVGFYGFVRVFVNFVVKVAVPNIPVKEGVIHLIPRVLIPPKKPGSTSSYEETEDASESLSVEELIARLEPYM